MPGARYRAPSVEALLLHRLDDLVAVYHRPSGRTHVVASPVPELLSALAGRAMTLSELLAVLAATFDLPDGEELRLQARLDELARAGLVTRE